jgi:hypothetical protein
VLKLAGGQEIAVEMIDGGWATPRLHPPANEYSQIQF